jgi:hypothetical protein
MLDAMWMKILLVSLICFAVNIPLGRLRERSRKFSLAWFFWIHASIPFIIALRIGLHLHPLAIPINIAAAVFGQVVGAAPEKKRRRLSNAELGMRSSE